MEAKVVIVLLAAFLTNQVTASSVPKVNGAFDEIIEIAEQVLLFVINLVEKAVTDEANSIKAILANLDYLRAKTLAGFEAVLQKEQELIKQLVTAYANRTSQTGIDILECVEDTESEFGDVRENSLNVSLICIDRAVEKTTGVLLEILDDANNITTDFKEETEQLEKCKSKIIPIDCIRDVITELGDIASTVPAKAKEDRQKAEKAFEQLEVAVETCVKNAAADAKEDDLNVFNDFAQCVYDKENNDMLSK